MIIKFWSDLHLEFGSTHMLKSLIRADSADIIIIAGDLHVGKRELECLEQINDMTTVPVVYIPGNHSYYGTSKSIQDTLLKELNDTLNSTHILNRDTFEFNGVTFAGATGWWDAEMGDDHLYALNDFSRIYDIKQFNNGTSWGIGDREFFESVLKEKDNVVCISHNAPSWKSISPIYRKSNINECFANHWDYLIDEYKPLVWIHGHMHDNINYTISDVPVMCNPYGYYRYGVNTNFEECGYIRIP